MNENTPYIRRNLKKKLDENRYEHTIGVAYTAMALAMRYQTDIDRAETAGLLHDCAKCFPDEIKIEKCQKYNISISPAEQANPSLLHAKLGAYLAMKKYRITDMEIINAIMNHTTGKVGMSMLDKIIFVADYIEPRRDKAANLSEVRQIAFIDLDEAVYLIMKQTLEYLKKKKSAIDSTTESAYRYYKHLSDEKKQEREGANN